MGLLDFFTHNSNPGQNLSASQQAAPDQGDSFLQKLFMASKPGRNFYTNQALRAEKEGQDLLGVPAGVPSALQEYTVWNRMSPQQKNDYLKVKRAQPVINLGGSQIIPNTADPSAPPQAEFPVTPKPEDMPDFRGRQARATAAGQVEGETGAQAAVTLPDVEAAAKLDAEHIDQLLKHPGLEASVGVKGPSAFLDFGNAVPGSPAADFQSILDQVKGGTFLQAYKTLKGGGAISEIEGTKAEQAIARLSTAQSEGGFKKALKEYKDIIDSGLQRYKKKAGSQNINQSAPIQDTGMDATLNSLDAQVAPMSNVPPPAMGPQGGGVVSYKDYFK